MVVGGTVFYATLAFLIPVVLGHGRLIEPPSRSSMWRFGFNTPYNYNDNQLFCGGFNNQWNTHNGACGVCGDPFQGPHDNEAGGIYATGTISRCYSTSTSTIEVKVDVTANHKGYFEYRLCEHNDTQSAITHECLNEHVLEEANTGLTKLLIDYTTGVKQHRLVLPPDLSCTQCVLQWRYHTGNNWGCDDDGRCCLGCGPQEEFYGCSDIAILPNCGTTEDNSDDTATSTETTQEKTTSTLTENTDATSTTVTKQTTTNGGDSGDVDNTITERCHAIGVWAKFANMDDWCVSNCGHTPPHCPATHCSCEVTVSTRQICTAAGVWKSSPGMHEWCDTNCNHDPPFCPASHCSCLP